MRNERHHLKTTQPQNWGGLGKFLMTRQMDNCSLLINWPEQDYIFNISGASAVSRNSQPGRALGCIGSFYHRPSFPFTFRDKWPSSSFLRLPSHAFSLSQPAGDSSTSMCTAGVPQTLKSSSSEAFLLKAFCLSSPVGQQCWGLCWPTPSYPGTFRVQDGQPLSPP